MNFGRISERLMKLAVSMNYLKLIRLTLHLFTVLQCQRRAIPTFRLTDRLHSRGRQLLQGSKLATNWSHMRLDFWLCA